MKRLSTISTGVTWESLPTRGARIETAIDLRTSEEKRSLPTRGARIETVAACLIVDDVWVAPHTGGAD